METIRGLVVDLQDCPACHDPSQRLFSARCRTSTSPCRRDAPAQARTSFKGIADVPGHQSLQSTAIYAKLNLSPLRRISTPWPGEQAEAQRIWRIRLLNTLSIVSRCATGKPAAAY